MPQTESLYTGRRINVRAYYLSRRKDTRRQTSPRRPSDPLLRRTRRRSRPARVAN